MTSTIYLNIENNKLKEDELKQYNLTNKTKELEKIVSDTQHIIDTVYTILQVVSLKSEEHKKLVNQVDFSKFYLAGGAIRDIYNANEIKDYDLFVNDKTSIESLKTLLLDEKNKNWIANRIKGDIHIIESKFKNINIEIYFMGKTDFIQLCIIYPKNPQAMIECFDFTINQNYCDLKKLALSKDLVSGNMWLNASSKIQFPINALMRIPKFQAKGYKGSFRLYTTIVSQCKNKQKIKQYALGMSGGKKKNATVSKNSNGN